MNNRKNLVSALLYQVVHIIYGLVVPRLILGCFGSDVNGLVSSITQFLSFISLFEGGLGAVVLAELYSPIEINDKERIKSILYSCQRFFNKLGILFIIYTTILAIIYSISVKDQFDIVFIISLVYILSLTTIAQYMFSITYKLYLQANQKIYITNYLTTCTLIVNLIITFIVIKSFPDIRILKLLSSAAFFVQPLIIRRLIPNDYLSIKSDNIKETVLKNRWSGFAQNLAHYVNMNTDIVLITLFCSLTDVSIYSVYLLGITALRSFVSYVTNSYQSALGKYIVQDRQEILEQKFKSFCIITWAVSLVIYCTCLLVINQFVTIYTNNVNDANYYQPVFALLITIANLIYCIREPYRLLILAAGKFKETNFGSIMEAGLNIGISLVLIHRFGLVGVAIGTVVAITYRLIYFIIFLNKGKIRIKLSGYFRYFVSSIIVICANIFLYFMVEIVANTVYEFICIGVIISVCESVIVMLCFVGPKSSMAMLKKLTNRV